MIRTDREYEVAVERLQDAKSRLNATRKRLKAEGLNPKEIKRALDPIRSFQLQFIEEVEAYENLKQGKFPTLENLGGLGSLLIALRIHKGLSQRELAQRLGVHETQVSRDERNEYHGITVARAGKILQALRTRLASEVVVEPATRPR